MDVDVPVEASRASFVSRRETKHGEIVAAESASRAHIGYETRINLSFIS